MSTKNIGIFIHPESGNVGIGTSQARAPLEVFGSIVPSSNMGFDLGSPTLRWRDLFLSGNSINLGGTTISRDATTGGIKFLDPNTNQPLDSTVRNLTASNLTVLGDYVTLNTITSNTEQMVITNAGTGPALKVTQTGANTIAEFFDDGNVMALKIADGGNVGIGTTNPQAKLHVNGTITIDEAIVFTQTKKLPRISYNNFTIECNGGSFYPVNRTTITFNYTGADQSWTVPANVYSIFVKLWGAGGGSGRAGGWTYGADGGGGGHSYALVPVTPSEILTIKIGSGGKTCSFGSVYGGGGGAGDNADITYGGTGGGGTYVFRGSTAIVIAGGGGGGGSSRVWTGMIGGAGGGLTGQKGESPLDSKVGFGGTGGSQVEGGLSASVGAKTIGSLYQGGQSHVNSYGGGGGGGYYGGGGGGYSEANTMGGGGGGSGFVATSCFMGGTFTGSLRSPAYIWDNDLPKSVSNLTLIAHGMQNVQNNIAANVFVGGAGFCMIYY